MKKFKVFLIGLFICFCGIVFNACSCSGSVVSPTGLRIVKVENAIQKDDGIYYAPKGAELTISYQINPANVSNTSVEVDFSRMGYISTQEMFFDSGSAKGSFKVKCDNACGKSGDEQLYVVLSVYASADQTLKKSINIVVVEPEILSVPSNVRIENGKLKFNRVENATSYKYIINGVEKQILQSESEEISVDANLQDSTEYVVQVVCVGDGLNYLDSEKSQEFKFKMLKTPVLIANNGELRFDNTEANFDSINTKEILVDLGVEGLENIKVSDFSSNKIIDLKQDKYKDILEFKISLTAISKNLTDSGYGIIDSAKSTEATITRLKSPTLKLVNSDSKGNPLDNSKLMLGDSLNSECFYEVELSADGVNKINITTNDGEINDIASKVASSNTQYSIKVTAKFKDGYSARYISSDEVSNYFFVQDCNATISVNDEGLVSLNGTNSNFSKYYLILNEDRIELSKTESAEPIDLSEILTQTGTYSVSILGVGSNLSNLGYCNAKNKTNIEITKLSKLEAFKITSDGGIDVTLPSENAGNNLEFNVGYKTAEQVEYLKSTTLSLSNPSSATLNGILDETLQNALGNGVELTCSVKMKKQGAIASSAVSVSIQKLPNISDSDIVSDGDLIKWSYSTQVPAKFKYSFDGVNFTESDNEFVKPTLEDFAQYIEISVIQVGVVQGNKTWLDSNVSTKRFEKLDKVGNVSFHNGVLSWSLEKAESFGIELVGGGASRIVIVNANNNQGSLNMLGTLIENGKEFQLDSNTTYTARIQGYSTSAISSGYSTAFSFTIQPNAEFAIIENASVYKIQGKSNTYKYVFKLDANENSITEFSIADKNVHKISAYVKGDDSKIKTINLSDETSNKEIMLNGRVSIKTIQKLETPEPKLDNNKVVWNPIKNATNYSITANGGLKTQKACEIDSFNVGENRFKISAIGNISNAVNPNSYNNFEYYISSDDSAELVIQKLDAPSVECENGVLKVSNYDEQFDYEIKIENNEVGSVLNGGEIKLNTILCDKVLDLKITAKKVGFINSDEATFKIYKPNSMKLSLNGENLVVTPARLNGFDSNIENKFVLETIKQVGNKISYEITKGADGYYINGTNAGVNSISIDLSSLNAGEYEFKLTAINENRNGAFFVNSDQKTISITKLKEPTLSLKNGVLELKTNNPNSNVLITIGEKTKQVSSDYIFDFETDWNSISAGEISIKVVANPTSINILKSNENSKSFTLLEKPNIYISNGELKIDNSNSTIFIDENNKGLFSALNFNFENGKTYGMQAFANGDNGTKISSRKSDVFAANVLSDVQNIEFDGGVLTWNELNGASKYLVTINGGIKRETSNTQFDLSSLSWSLGENRLFVKGIGSLSTIEGDKYSTSGYLTASTEPSSIEINVINKALDFKINNCVLSWESAGENALYRISILNKSNEIKSQFETNSLSINLQEKNLTLSSGVYFAKVEVLKTDKTVILNKDEKTNKFVFLNNNELFSNIGLRNGRIEFEFSGGMLAISQKLIGLYGEYLGEEIGVDDEEKVTSAIAPIDVLKVLVNGTPYFLNSKIDETDADNPIYYVSLDELFGAGVYSVKISAGNGSNEFIASNFIGSVSGVKPTQPVFPVNAGGSAFIEDGKIEFGVSKINNNGTIENVLDYYLNFYNETGECVLRKAINLTNGDISNGIAIVNLKGFDLFGENKLSTNTIYFVGIQTIGNSQRFDSVQAKSGSPFGKLEVLARPVIENGLINVASCYANDEKLVEKIGGVRINVYYENNLVKTFNYQLGDEISLNGLAFGKYIIKVQVLGDLLGLFDSDEFSEGVEIDKLATPNVELENGEFVWAPIKDSEGVLVVNYAYGFLSNENDGFVLNLNASAENADSKIITVLPDDLNNPNLKYSIRVVATESGGENNYIQSDVKTVEFYNRVQMPYGFNLNDETLTWEHIAEGEGFNAGNITYRVVLTTGDIDSNSSIVVETKEKQLNLNRIENFDLYNQNVSIYVKAIVDVGSVINSANVLVGTFIISSVPTGVELDNNGRLIIASGDNIDELNQNRLKLYFYEIKLTGKIKSGSDVINNASIVIRYNGNKISEFGVDNNIIVPYEELNNVPYKLENNIYVCDFTTESGNYDGTLSLISGEQYSLNIKYVGDLGEINSDDLTKTYRVSSKWTNTNIKAENNNTGNINSFVVAEKMDVLISKKGSDLGLAGNSYVVWNKINNIEKYVIKLDKLDEDDALIETEYLSMLQDGNIFEQYDNMMRYCIDDLIQELDDNVAKIQLSIRSYGNKDFMEGMEYSERISIVIPKTPTQMAYGYSNYVDFNSTYQEGYVYWRNTTPETGLKLEVIYKNDYNYGESANYSNILRTLNMDGTITDVITIHKDEVGEKNGIGVYKLKYLTKEIQSIKVIEVFNEAGNIYKQVSSNNIFAINNNGVNNKFELFASGDGSKNLPFEINSNSHFVNISKYLDSNFTLTSNLTFTSTNTTTMISGVFNGTFNGNKNSITPYYANKSIAQRACYSLFENIGENGVVKDLNIVFDENITYKPSTFAYFGGVAIENNGLIEGINVSGKIQFSGNNNNSSYLDGGVVVMTNKGVVKNSIINVIVLNTSMQGFDFGGVAYANECEIIKCGASGVLTGSLMGGISANLINGTITQCYSKVNFQATKINSIAGGIVGESKGGKIEFAYYNNSEIINNGEFNGTSFGGANGLKFGGFIGSVVSGSDDNVTQVDKSYMKISGVANSSGVGGNYSSIITSNKYQSDGKNMFIGLNPTNETSYDWDVNQNEILSWSNNGEKVFKIENSIWKLTWEN